VPDSCSSSSMKSTRAHARHLNLLSDDTTMHSPCLHLLPLLKSVNGRLLLRVAPSRHGRADTLNQKSEPLG
jgi:hypothetical protein